jgi:hypothetical protein
MMTMLGLVALGFGLQEVQAQPENFYTSLHYTREGKPWWYAAENGGFELLTGIPISELGCTECHGKTDADGVAYDDDLYPYPGPGCYDCHPSQDFFNVQESQCYGCHGRQNTEANGLGLSDVHRDAGFTCWTCHGTEDLHGDGTEYFSMLQPGAIDADCENCHSDLPASHADYDPHGGALHCAACHTSTVISCYNCHFESQVEAHVKRAKQPLSGFVMLVNREKDGKVYPASFQSVSYQDQAFVAFGPYAAHTIQKEGRGCPECHNNMGGMNEAITQYNATGQIKFAAWNDDTDELTWLKGIVPIPADYEQTLKMDFITYDGDPSDPPGPSTNWSSIGKDTWDLHQMFFASPLTESQMAALGFEIAEPPPSGGWTVRLTFSGDEFQVSFEEFAGVLLVTTTQDGSTSTGIGTQMGNVIFWMDISGALFYGSVDESAGTMQGIVFGPLGDSDIWLAQEN